jgi:hypothetical protein
MLKTTDDMLDASVSPGGTCPTANPAWGKSRPRVALLSNPKSTGNLAKLPRIRA